MIQRARRTAFFLLLSAITMTSRADPASSQPATDIAALPSIVELPDPFLFQDGSRVKTSEDWKRRRSELQELFLRYEYGRLPEKVPTVTGKLDSSTVDPKTGASVENVTLHVGAENGFDVPIVLTSPPGPTTIPVIVTGDLCWGPVKPEVLADALSRGYAVCEFDRTRFGSDSPDRTHGIYLLDSDPECGRTAAWAWGYSRVIDSLLKTPRIDPKKIIISGHSRGGKAVLLAGALDERVALTNPNASGSGGGGCFRVQGPDSEDLKTIVTHFPYWFAPHFPDFIGHVDRLPFDQHELKALIAPRALLMTDSVDDKWANPSGAQMSYLAAKVVFDFLDAGDKIGLHYRHGSHAHTEEDWKVLLDFADAKLMGKKVDAKFDVLQYPDQHLPFSWTAPPK